MWQNDVRSLFISFQTGGVCGVEVDSVLRNLPGKYGETAAQQEYLRLTFTNRVHQMGN